MDLEENLEREMTGGNTCNGTSIMSLNSSDNTSNANDDKQYKSMVAPVTTAVDIWASGVCLYMFVFGRLPFDVVQTDTFDASSLAELQRRIINNHLAVLWSIDKDLEKLLLQMLKKNPLHRIQIDDVVIHPWVRGEKFGITKHGVDAGSGCRDKGNYRNGVATIKRLTRIISNHVNAFSFQRFISRMRTYRHQSNFFIIRWPIVGIDVLCTYLLGPCYYALRRLIPHLSTLFALSNNESNCVNDECNDNSSSMMGDSTEKE